jgi:hypothetical protein
MEFPDISSIVLSAVIDNHCGVENLSVMKASQLESNPETSDQFGRTFRDSVAEADLVRGAQKFIRESTTGNDAVCVIFFII